MPKNNVPYSVGVNSELEKALQRATMLDFGEALFIPTGSRADADKIRRYFFRQRRSAQAQGIQAGVVDPAEADPWRGLVTELGADRVGLTIKRPRQLTEIEITRADGTVEKEIL